MAKKINEAGKLRGARAGAGARKTSRTVGTTIARNPVRVAALPGVDRERSVRAAHASSGTRPSSPTASDRATGAAPATVPFAPSKPAGQVIAEIPKGVLPASPETKAAADISYQDSLSGKITRYTDKEGEFATKPRQVREPGLSTKDAAALGIKTIPNVATKHRVAGAEAEAFPGAPRFHSGNPDEARPDVPEITGAGKAAQTSYGVSPKNAEISGNVADSGVLGHQPISKLTAKTVPVPSEPYFPDDERMNAFLQGQNLPTESPKRQVTVVTARGKGPVRSTAGLAAAKGANVTDDPRTRPLKNSIASIANLVEYILKANIKTLGWVPLKSKGEDGPTPSGPPGKGPRPTAGFVRGPRRHYTQSGGENSPPQARERAKAEFDALFGQEESYMDPNKIANKIIREAFTTPSGDRRNTTSGHGMADKGGTARLMLSGEWFGSPAWAFDQSSSPAFEKSAELQITQATTGQGEGTGKAPSMMDAVTARDIVDNLLEDSPASIYDDPESVGYMLRVLGEAGYTEFAERCSEICESATEESVVEISKMIEKLEADKADPYLVEGLQDFAALIISENETEQDPSTEAQDDKSTSDTPAETEPTAE
jgi:hypothetical protein